MEKLKNTTNVASTKVNLILGLVNRANPQIKLEKWSHNYDV